MSELTGPGGLVGRTLTVEELAQTVPDYPDGRRPRPRAVARRLRPILELVERGPNGSLGRGATYVVRERAAPPAYPEATDTPDDLLRPDPEWLEESVAKMTRTKEEKGKR